MKKIFMGLVFMIVLFSLAVLIPLHGHAEQMEPSEFSQGVEYTLLMSREDKVCKHMLTLFNQDLAKFGTEKYNEHEEFRSIGWKKETITRMEGDREVTDFVEVALADINNDGTKDLVFRSTDFLGGYEVQWLNIFPGLSPSEKRWSRMEILHSPGRISDGGYVLDKGLPAVKKKKLMQIPPMAIISRLELFRSEGETYVGMRPLYELVAGTDLAVELSRVYVITKYREGKYGSDPDTGKNETGKRDDICYLKIHTKPFIPGGQ